MKIEKITVSGLNSALAAIGLSYGDEYDPFNFSTKKLANIHNAAGSSMYLENTEEMILRTLDD